MACVTTEAAERFLATDWGRGDGSGDGSGWGSGDGSGWGSGDGSGWGEGDGSGRGDGDGFDDGRGRGEGKGEDWGWGTDDGEGSGSNRGISAFCGNPAWQIDGVPTMLRSIHGNAAMGYILRADLTLEKCYVAKGAGFFAHGETLRAAQAALEQKIMDNMPVEEKIEKFMEAFKPAHKYPAKEFYAWHNTLTGSCEMGRREFAREHGIDIENDAMTPEEFIRLTENAYGASVIRQLKGAMSIED